MSLRTEIIFQSALCFLCLWMGFRYSNPLIGSEFSGGTITGLILDLFETGLFLLLLAGVLTFFSTRVGAAIALIAALLSLPLYVYRTAPGAFRIVLRGEYSVPLQTYFVWNIASVAGLFVGILLVLISARTIVRRSHQTAH